MSWSIASAQPAPQLNESDPAWGCYDPAPGHPTPAEKVAFVDQAKEIAKRAEASLGVPASALAAMSMVESGYGWTRTAKFANNYFGWKGPEGSSAAYHLKCQPTASDPNSYYARFASLEASMMAVADRLKNSPDYWADTARYLADIAAGVDPRLATKLWIDAIAPAYNGEPATYRRTLRRFMNDPLAPSDTLNPATTLYAIAPSQPPSTKFADLSSSDAYRKVIVLAGDKLAPGARYTDACIQGSGAVQLDYPGYQGVPVRRCIYKLGGLTGLVYTLHPTREQLAGWIAFACLRAGAADPSACAQDLFAPKANPAAGIWGSNNAQYPVSGNVIERGDEAGCIEPGTYYNVQFRHGITVQLKAESSVCIKGARSIEAQEADRKSAVSRYRNVARVSALSVSVYDTATGKGVRDSAQPRPIDTMPRQIRWGELNHLSHLTAIEDGVNSMLNLRAQLLHGSAAPSRRLRRREGSKLKIGESNAWPTIWRNSVQLRSPRSCTSLGNTLARTCS